jgi:hypothetical protein
VLQGHSPILPRSNRQAGRGILILHHHLILKWASPWVSGAAPYCSFQGREHLACLGRRLLGKTMAELIMPAKSWHQRALTILRSNQL